MPDARRELQTIRPASHTTALGALFIPEEGGGAQGGNCRERKFTSLVRAGRPPGRRRTRVSAPHEPELSSHKNYGNSRVTNLAGCSPELVRAWRAPAGNQ